MHSTKGQNNDSVFQKNEECKWDVVCVYREAFVKELNPRRICNDGYDHPIGHVLSFPHDCVDCSKHSMGCNECGMHGPCLVIYKPSVYPEQAE